MPDLPCPTERLLDGLGDSRARRHGEKTLAELATQFDVHPNEITQWKGQLLEQAAVVFNGGKPKPEDPVDLKALHAKIGELTLENDFLESGLINVVIERFWRTLKYEKVYLRAYETVSAARESIAKYLALYRARRPHTANHDLTLDAT